MRASILLYWLPVLVVVILSFVVTTLDTPVLQDPEELRDFRECTRIQRRLCDAADPDEIDMLHARFHELRTRIWHRLSDKQRRTAETAETAETRRKK
jgi:hypothetical protein